MRESLARLKERGHTSTAPVSNAGAPPTDFFASMFSSPAAAALPAETAVKDLPLDLLDPWRDEAHKAQPFKPYAEKELLELAENIRQNGVISPIRVRSSPFIPGRFQILAGHNRVAAARLAGLATIPAITLQATDDEAKLILVDSNLYQREHLLPSEKAFAYKMQLDTLKHQGKRTDLTGGNVCHQSDIDEEMSRKVCTEPDAAGETCGNVCRKSEKSREAVAANAQVSARTIQNFIRLTYLRPPLLDMVDAETIPFTAGVSISFLPAEAQERLIRLMQAHHVGRISRSQAEELKAFRDRLDDNTILRILGKAARSVKPQSLKLQIDYPREIVKKLADDEVLQTRLRAVIDDYIREMKSREKAT